MTTLDLVVPVYNEEADLGPSVRRLDEHLRAQFPYSYRITIADNASTDGTARIAAELAAQYECVRVVRLEEKGRGRALAHTWSTSDAAVLAYMDVDLSTDLSALLPLVAPLITGHSDLAIGSRLAPQARVVRGPKREFISRCYNLILRRALAVQFTDAQCGFKAIRADVAQGLLPLVRDTGWFFDTELLVLAQNAGLRIHEVPVDWTDDPDSRVDILSTAMADLKGIARIAKGLLTGAIPLQRVREQLGRNPPERKSLLHQLVRFGAVGVFSTLAYLLIFWLARGFVGAQAANVIALLLTAIANTAANRRLTFGIRGTADALRHQAQGLVVFGLALLFTSSSLALLHNPSRVVEIVAVVVANLLATVMRFVLFRSWVFRQARTGAGAKRLGGGSNTA
ncbi:bifunctional glycosyltransferase family 2/GtrA family protein [Allorhizocola rhizosphaerae]|uniref:bifunctional glycosyltransferase family 2/GtrA family protein n=1 Tax=Allorhizocola rhizosphaerae TaxID=1872709 RepID=UPI001B8CBFF0|nr:bifunctional glycosyltransferase family 2/GtrA family protein [Allorhizocola rhizosphaerae]